MREYKLIFSNDAPAVKDAIWGKMVAGGFTLYAPVGGTWKPLKLVDDNSTVNTSDDVVQDLIGSVEDTKTANTINGAKAFAQDAADAVVGTAEDTSADMTLYGLKAYIDAQVGG